MTGIEITLIIIGLVFVIGSFFIKDKLSQKDLDTISDLSAKELKIIMDKQMAKVDNRVEEVVGDAIDGQVDETKRRLEKTTNEKIMAINEYSDTVLEAINKSHNEVMFLYSMLNEKHAELTGVCSQLQRYTDNTLATTLENAKEEAREREYARELSKEPVKEVVQPKLVEEPVPVVETEMDEYVDTLTESQKPLEVFDFNEEYLNHNARILALHKQGYSDVEIAKELNLGLGEVRLVIGLFKGDADNEI